MEIDYSALASRVAAFSDVLGCMILSPDGLVLGSFPPGDGDGDGIKPAWMRFAGLGEPDRSFVKFADEVWAYVRAGSYAAFAVATGTTRPGVLLDHLEQALLVAGESREQRTVARAPGRVELVAGTKPKAVAPAAPEASPAPVAPRADGPAGDEPPTETFSAVPTSERTPSRMEDTGPAREEPAGPAGEEPSPPSPFEETEIDPVALAREFAGLLQEDRPSDEDNA